MGSSWMAIAEFVVLDGVVVAWGLWELYSLRRDRLRDRDRQDQDKTPGPDDEERS